VVREKVRLLFAGCIQEPPREMGFETLWGRSYELPTDVRGANNSTPRHPRHARIQNDKFCIFLNSRLNNSGSLKWVVQHTQSCVLCDVALLILVVAMLTQSNTSRSCTFIELYPLTPNFLSGPCPHGLLVSGLYDTYNEGQIHR
jgi:hypothetical protein